MGLRKIVVVATALATLGIAGPSIASQITDELLPLDQSTLSETRAGFGFSHDVLMPGIEGLWQGKSTLQSGIGTALELGGRGVHELSSGLNSGFGTKHDAFSNGFSAGLDGLGSGKQTLHTGLNVGQSSLFEGGWRGYDTLRTSFRSLGQQSIVNPILRPEVRYDWSQGFRRDIRSGFDAILTF